MFPDLHLNFVVQSMTIVAGHYYQGYAHFFGADFHVVIFRVQEGEEVQLLPDANEMVREQFKMLQSINEGALSRMTIPQMEGQYVMHIYPFAE